MKIDGKIITKAEKVDSILSMLEEMYPNPEVPLAHRDAYTLLVAVLLSAQCTDKMVNRITPKLFERAGDPYTMKEAPAEEIEAIIRPCGLAPAKSKNIVGLSRIIVEKHRGAVPKSFKALEALPGVGHKTASVVMAQWFGRPAFPIDTHIHRLARRWGLSSGKNVSQTEKDLKRLIPKKKWNKAHLQLIYFAREHCPARGHIWTQCPICKKHMLHKLRPKA